MDDVAKLPFLALRKTVYYYRRRVPLDLVSAFGKEVGGSLRTTDRNEAAKAWLIEQARWDDEFDRQRLIQSTAPAETASTDASPAFRV